MRSMKTAVAGLVVGLLCGLQQRANSQGSPVAHSPKKSPTTVNNAPIGPVKCTDPDSAQSCKSFKQLMEAHDKDLIAAVLGSQSVSGRHFAYVCFSPHNDAFRVVSFNEPPPKDYRPYTPSDDSTLTAFAWKQEAFAFETVNIQIINAQNKWFNDHQDYTLYSFRHVYVDSYEDGLLASSIGDFGKWSRDSYPKLTQNSSAAFQGAHYWLERFNADNNGTFSQVDDPSHGHISVDETSIYVHYSFTNRADDATDYMLMIRRSTGRFTQTFKPSKGEPLEDHGTCLVFK